MRCWAWPTTCAVSSGASRAAPPPEQDTSRVAGEFARLLWREVLKAMPEGVFPVPRVAGGSLYWDLALEALAGHLARQGGLTDFLARALSRAPGSREGKEIPFA